jgi:hypothetical protein
VLRSASVAGDGCYDNVCGALYGSFIKSEDNSRPGHIFSGCRCSRSRSCRLMLSSFAYCGKRCAGKVLRGASGAGDGGSESGVRRRCIAALDKEKVKRTCLLQFLVRTINKTCKNGHASSHWIIIRPVSLGAQKPDDHNFECYLYKHFCRHTYVHRMIMT